MKVKHKQKTFICKKCKSTEFTVEQIIKRKKTKFYSVCDKCKRKIALSTKKFATNNFQMFIVYLIQQDRENSSQINVNTKINQLNKEYKYIYNNLILLAEYLFCTNFHKKHESSAINWRDLLAILSEYKDGIDNLTIQKILFDLLEKS